MSGVAGLCRAFLSTLCEVEVQGQEAFTALLDSRQNRSQLSRGLITGVLPAALYTSSPEVGSWLTQTYHISSVESR